MLAGGSKTFKTWMLLDLAMSIAAGVPWLGFDTAQAKVLYVDFEFRPKTLAKATANIKAARNLTWEKPMLEMMPLRGKAAAYDELIPKILDGHQRQGIRGHHPRPDLQNLWQCR